MAALTKRELAQLVSSGENQYLEFKQVVPDPAKLARELIAFANSGGGTVMIGVDDNGALLGLKDTSQELFAVAEAATRFANPEIQYSIDVVSVSRKRDVLLVRIPSSDDRPHYLIADEHTGAKRAFIRVDDKSVQASREAVRLMRLATRESETVFEFGDKELLLMRYLETYGKITVVEFARLAGIPKRRASHTLVLMTRANVLAIHHQVDEDIFTLNSG